jgi:elongation factor G
MPPDPLIEVALTPLTPGDAEKLTPGLARLQAGDPWLKAWMETESGTTILAGQTEGQLSRAIDVLRQTEHLGLDVGAPQVAYRETLRDSATVEAVHAKALGPRGEFARVVLHLAPGDPGSGLLLTNLAPSMPAEYWPGVLRGLEDGLKRGCLAGFPLIDLKVSLIDGAWHDVDSNQKAFELATLAALGKLRETGKPMLLEPIMAIVVTAPAEFGGQVAENLTRRRGRISSRGQAGQSLRFEALVPLANLFGVEGALAALSQGQARCLLTFDHYAPVPQHEDDPPPFPPAAAMRA